jgi:hypothetical protein
MVLGGAAPFLTLCLILEKTRFGSRAAAEPVRILRSPDVTVTVTASTPGARAGFKSCMCLKHGGTSHSGCYNYPHWADASEVGPLECT